LKSIITKLKKGIIGIPKLLSTIIWCLDFSWSASKSYTLVRIAVGVSLPLIAVLMAFVSREVINILANQGGSEAGDGAVLLVMLAFLLAFALVRLGMQRTMEYCQAMHEDILSGKLSTVLMERVLSADLEYFDDPSYHDKIAAADTDSHAITYITWNAMNAVSAVVAFIGVFAVLAQVRPLYGFVMLVAALPSSVIAARYTKLLYMINLDQINGMRRMGYCRFVATARDYAQDMRLFGAGGILVERYRGIWKKLFDKRRSTSRKRAILTGALECLPEVTVALIGVDIVFSVLAGSATVGDYSLCISLAAQLWVAISTLSSSIMQIYDNKMKIANYEGIKNFVGRVHDHGSEQLERVGEIEFEDVRFAYPGSEKSALDGVRFMLRDGEKVALVGLNGSGKTTLIKLLLRMYDPDNGTIRINGKDIREYSLASLRSNFSAYFQDMHNYSFTLRENLDIADSGRKDADAVALNALEAATCGDLLGRTGEGLDTCITRLFSDTGIELSGGQHQKLAIARALYRRHTSLLLDEPSSNLDPESEHEIFKSLRQRTEGMTTLFTSHRLSNVSLADRVVVLESGKVIEDGTQKELLQRGGRYAELFRLQQEKYLINNEARDKSEE